ncbi:hypothetical protein [Shewanella chilikensis]|uniref:hypothetical protein n=1 Tax=Shewanella chilikensis TaxID=558541 RepID=UPI003A97D480
MRNLNLLAVMVVAFISLAGCASFHEERAIEWDSRLSSREFDATEELKRMQAVLHSQVIVASHSSAGVVEGLGVPLSPMRIATVAHVVDHLSVGEDLKIAYVPFPGGQLTERDARLAYVSSESETAIIEVLGTALPESYIPTLCSKSVGGNGVSALKPHVNNGRLTGSQVFSGYVTNITRLPLVGDEFDAEAKKSGFSPKRMEGQERVVMVSVSNATAGNSGGAIYDVEQSCVLGLASMVASVEEFEFPEQLKQAVGLPDSDLRGNDRPLLFAIPVTAYVGL